MSSRKDVARSLLNISASVKQVAAGLLEDEEAKDESSGMVPIACHRAKHSSKVLGKVGRGKG